MFDNLVSSVLALYLCMTFVDNSFPYGSPTPQNVSLPLSPLARTQRFYFWFLMEM